MLDMTRAARCAWCGREGADLEAVHCDGESMVVHPTHRADLERFCRRSANFKHLFVAVVIGFMLLGYAGQVVILAGAMGPGLMIVGAAVGGTGLTLLAWPFATPQTVARLGVKRSAWIVRAVAVFVLAIAITIVVAGLWKALG